MPSKYTLGIDIGGTKIEASLIELSERENLDHPIALDEKGILSFRIVERERIPTERDKGYEDVLKRLKALLKKIIQTSKLDSKLVNDIGIGMPGSVHPQNQKMIHGNSLIFENKDIKADLLSFFSSEFGTHPLIAVNNDANCFALAESLGGAGILFNKEESVPFSEQISIGVILGTGCGGGVIIQGKILAGKIGGGGEIGHTVLHLDGRECYCGRKGCAELYLSGTGFEISYNLKNTSMSEDTLKAREIFELITQTKDKTATDVLAKYQDDLILFLGNLSNIFDPHYFVLGGGLSNQDSLYQGLEEKLASIIFLKDYAPKIYKNKLGDSAGVLGAALLPFLK